MGGFGCSLGRHRRTRRTRPPAKRKPEPSWISSHGRASRDVAAARACSDLIVGGLGQHVVVDQHREPAIGASARASPGVERSSTLLLFTDRHLEECLAPGLEISLDRAGPVGDHRADRPPRVALDVPGQLIGLDPPSGATNRNGRLLIEGAPD